mmetsp:Transcript_35750/g.86297  ORF Transcript_35750/g.86297 Transcript_35750/m.86297 type:complete len:360 (+) Transcript_35750:135-1214(+)
MPKQRYPSHRSQSSSGPSSLSSAKSTARTAQSPGSTSTIGFDATVLSAKDQIHEIRARTTRKEEEEIVLKRKLVPRLAKRAYHLEDGNTWFQDWAQYQKNTHPVFGLCMYHRLHPIRFPQRFIILVGSIAFGFAITNVVYLGFLKDENAGDAVNAVYDVTGKAAEFQQRYTKIELQQSMLFLITVGSFLHSMFDMLIWYLMACFCFRHGGIKVNKLCQTFGIYAAVLIVMVAVAASTSVAVMRLNEDSKREAEYEASMAEQFAAEQLGGGEDGSGETSQSTSNFTFLIGYALELVVALFVFYFITSTVFFSGILGCGRLPILGGRPYEMRKAATENADDPDEQELEEDEDATGLRGYDL